MKEGSKGKILQKGARIIHLKGYNNTGIQEILDAARVPKGSFYNYFKSKEDFGLQVIDFFVDHFDEVSKGILEDASIPPLKRIEKTLDQYMGLFKSMDYSCGCPIGNLSQEMGDLSPIFRERLRRALDLIAEKYAMVLREAQGAGEIPGNLDVMEAAYFIVSSWHGALVHMKVVKGPGPLENHKKFIFERVLRP